MGSPGARSHLDLEEAEAAFGKAERSGKNVSALGLWPHFREVPEQLLPACGLQPCSEGLPSASHKSASNIEADFNHY